MDVSVPEAAGILIFLPEFESDGRLTEERVQPVLIRGEGVRYGLRQPVLPGKGMGSAVEGDDLVLDCCPQITANPVAALSCRSRKLVEEDLCELPPGPGLDEAIPAHLLEER